MRGRLFDQFRPINAGLQRLMRRASQRAPRRTRYALRKIADRLAGIERTNDLLRRTFPWAVEEAQARYADTLSRTDI